MNHNQAYLHKMAKQHLSANWEGNGPDWSKDISVVFNKQNVGFNNEDMNGLQFAVKIQNKTGLAKRLCLNPGHFASVAALVAAGHICDLIMGDGRIAGADDAHGFIVTAQGTSTVAELLSFIKFNPTRVSKVVVSANDVAIYEGTFSIKNANPFRSEGEDIINMSDYFDRFQNQDKKIEIPTDETKLQLDDQTLLFLDVPAQANGVNSVEITMTFKIGAIENAAIALRRKAEESLGY